MDDLLESWVNGCCLIMKVLGFLISSTSDCTSSYIYNGLKAVVINQEEESDVVCVLGGESVSRFLNHTPQTQLEQTIW